MSGNANQRKQARDLKELIELGRQQRDLIEEHKARLRTRYDEIADLRTRLAVSEAESARQQDSLVKAGEHLVDAAERLRRFEDAAADATVRDYEYVRHLAAVQERMLAAEARLSVFDAAGSITRVEHRRIVKTSLEKATRKLRERLRRQRERLLGAPGREWGADKSTMLALARQFSLLSCANSPNLDAERCACSPCQARRLLGAPGRLRLWFKWRSQRIRAWVRWRLFGWVRS